MGKQVKAGRALGLGLAAASLAAASPAAAQAGESIPSGAKEDSVPRNRSERGANLEMLLLLKETSQAEAAHDYVAATGAYEKLMRLAERQGEEDPKVWLAILLGYAVALGELERYEDAVPLLQRAAAMATSSGTIELEVPASIALATYLQLAGRLGETETVLERLRRVAAPRLPASSELRPMIETSFATLYIEQGRYREAEQLLRPAVASFRGNELSLGARLTLGSLAAVLLGQGKLEEAERLLRDAVAAQLAAGAADDPSTQILRLNQAVAALAQDRLAEADRLAKQAAVALAATTGDIDVRTIDALLVVASVLLQRGRPKEAEELLREASGRSGGAMGPTHPATLRVASARGQALGELGRHAEAETLLRDVHAKQSARIGSAHTATLYTLERLALVHSAMGKLTEAEKEFASVLQARRVSMAAAAPSLIDVMLRLGELRVRLGRTAEAERLLREALKLEDGLPREHDLTLRTEAALVDLLLRRPDGAAEAKLHADRLVVGLRTRRAALQSGAFDGTDPLLDSLQDSRQFIASADAAWAAAPGGPDARSAGEAFLLLQEASSGPAGRAVALAAARQAAARGGPELEAAARHRQDLALRWQTLGTRLAEGLARPGADGAAYRRTVRDSQRETEQALAALEAKLRREAPAYFEFVTGAPLAVSEAQALLSPGEAVILIVPGSRGTHLFVLTRNRFEWRRSGLTDEQVAKAVSALRPRAGTLPLAAAPFDRATAYRLHRELIEPVTPALAGIDHLYVVATGPLQALPIGILVTEPPVGDDSDAEALRRTSWFADRFALVQMPSVRSLRLLRGDPAGAPRPSPNPFLGFGDPAVFGGRAPARGSPPAQDGGPAGAAVEGETADQNLLRQLSRIPFSAQELEQMRVALGAPAQSVKVRAEATEAAVRASDLGSTAIIAFATHALPAGSMSGLAEPGLVLSPPPVLRSPLDDGFLAASEVAALNLAAEWVILSACDTAAEDGPAGAGLSDLVRAFFFAGADALLASHWAVDDKVAATVTADVVGRTRERPGLSKPQALRDAMIAVRNDRSDPRLAHPAAWGPLSFFGDAGRQPRAAAFTGGPSPAAVSAASSAR